MNRGKWILPIVAACLLTAGPAHSALNLPANFSASTIGDGSIGLPIAIAAESFQAGGQSGSSAAGATAGRARTTSRSRAWRPS